MTAERVGYRYVVGYDTSRPSLEPAAWRILDAGDRCNALEDAVREAAQNFQAPLHARAHLDQPVGSVTLEFGGTGDELQLLQRRVTTLASEVLHHARAALDYCIYYACWNDSGVRNLVSQFPLALNEAEWLREVKGRRCKGLNPTHVEWIRSAQPYSGVGWSRNLKRLSNSDKHRETIELLPAYEIQLNKANLTPDPLGSADHVGFEVTDRVLDVLIGVTSASESGGGHVPARPLLWDIVKGAGGVVNKFLDEADMGTIDFSPAVKG